MVGWVPASNAGNRGLTYAVACKACHMVPGAGAVGFRTRNAQLASHSHFLLRPAFSGDPARQMESLGPHVQLVGCQQRPTGLKVQLTDLTDTLDLEPVSPPNVKVESDCELMHQSFLKASCGISGPVSLPIQRNCKRYAVEMAFAAQWSERARISALNEQRITPAKTSR